MKAGSCSVLRKALVDSLAVQGIGNEMALRNESANHSVPERGAADRDRQERHHNHPGIAHQVPAIQGSAHSPLKNDEQTPEKLHRSPDIQGWNRRKVFDVGETA